MKKYELNGLGKDWIYEGNCEQEAIKDYINQVGGFTDISQYEKYCKDLGMSSEISFKEVIESKED